MRVALPDVFTIEDAYAAGWTMSALKNAVRRRRIVRVRRGVYARVAEPDLRIRILAAARTFPAAAVSHRSAAVLHGMPLVGPPPRRPELTVAPRGNADLLDAHPYRARLRDHDVVDVEGIRVTSPARTAIDIARHCTFATAVTVLDAALHGPVAADELVDVLTFCANWFGATKARRALAFADGRAESPLESLSRITMARLGLPRPELQTELLAGGVRLIGRGDFYWDEFGVVGEADGRGKYLLRDDRDPVAAFVAEKDREAALQDLNLITTRWEWSHATRDTATLSHRVHSALQRGTARDRAGLPRLWTPRYTPLVGAPFLPPGRAR